MPDRPGLLMLMESRPPSCMDRAEQVFRARPDEWIDARVFLGCAGFAGWRTRISTLRRERNMDIVNRTYRRNGFTVSEYRWNTGAQSREVA